MRPSFAGRGGAVALFQVGLFAGVALLATLTTEIARADEDYIHCGAPGREIAIEACGRILSRNPAPSDDILAIAHYDRAVAVKDGGDAAAARRDLDASIKLKPLASAYFLRGVIAMDAQNHEAALRDYAAASRLEPSNVAILIDRALVLDSTGDLDGAAKALESVLKLEPGNATAINQRANLYAKLGRNDDAKRGWDRAAALDPQIAAVFKQNQRFVRVLVPPKYPLPFDAAAIGAGSRVALVVGNGQYQFAQPLANPGNDARLIAETLKSLGFDVKLEFDVDHDSLVAALAAFKPKAATADIAAIFYAGHGIQVAMGNTGENFILPVDAKIAALGDVDREGVAAAKLLAAMIGAQSRILFLDACRGDPFPNRSGEKALGETKNGTRHVSRGLAPLRVDNGVAGIDADGGTLVVFSTAANHEARDDALGAPDSPFSAALAKNVRLPGVEIKNVIVRVAQDVQNATGRTQTPFMSSSLTQEVYLAGH